LNDKIHHLHATCGDQIAKGALTSRRLSGLARTQFANELGSICMKMPSGICNLQEAET